MTRAWFTEDEMKKMTITQIRVVAEYFKVPVQGKKKNEIIAAIMDSWKGDDAEETMNGQPMSVQVQRIYQSLKGGQNQ